MLLHAGQSAHTFHRRLEQHDALVDPFILRRPLALAAAVFCLLPCLAGGAESKTANKSDWWAFKPATRPAVPQSAIGNQQLVINNPIDAFIRARLAEKNLQPSPEADPSR